MWQKVAKFKGAEYFRKALYMDQMVVGSLRMLSVSNTVHLSCDCLSAGS